jgi:hypothetical protein
VYLMAVAVVVGSEVVADDSVKEEDHGDTTDGWKKLGLWSDSVLFLTTFIQAYAFFI